MEHVVWGRGRYPNDDDNDPSASTPAATLAADVQASVGRMSRSVVVLVVSTLTAITGVARAQTYDFATCDPAVTKITPCSTTTTRCCHVDTSPGSSFNQSGSDYALVIPMDSCHQGGTADDAGK